MLTPIMITEMTAITKNTRTKFPPYYYSVYHLPYCVNLSVIVVTNCTKYDIVKTTITTTATIPIVMKTANLP